MDDGPFFIDGRHVSGEECRRLFQTEGLGDRQQRCLDWVEGETVVDIGCYSGAFVDALVKADLGRRVIGVDYDPENLRIARYLYPQHTYIRASAYALGMDDASVDCITFQEVIEHLEGAAAAIKEINRVLKPGGTLILSTPHPYYWRDMAAFIAHEVGNRIRGRRQLRTAIYFAESEWNRHIYCWTPSTLLTLLVTNGFEYAGHQYSADANNRLEAFFIRLFPFFGPAQIIKVRKIGEAPRRTI